MQMRRGSPANFSEYASGFPKPVQQLLKKMRSTIRKAAPKAQERISYGIPAFDYNGLLVWFAAHTTHIGLYPRAETIEVFKKDLSKFKCTKGAIQFPFDEPFPTALVSRIVKFRVKQNLRKAK